VIRTSWQIDSDFMFVNGRFPYPLFFEHQEQMLASDKKDNHSKEKLKNFIDGKPLEECVPSAEYMKNRFNILK
jgi:hypothetical protein